MLIAAIIYYSLASLIISATLLTDEQRMEWYGIVFLVVAWPLFVPIAAGAQLVKNIKTLLQKRRDERRRKMRLFCRKLYQLDLISHNTLIQALEVTDH